MKYKINVVKYTIIFFQQLNCAELTQFIQRLSSFQRLTVLDIIFDYMAIHN